MPAVYYKVTKGPDKGFIGIKDAYAIADGMAKKGQIRLTDSAGLESVVVSSKHVVPAGKDGQKAVIDKQIKGLVNQMKDLLNQKKRLDLPDLTEKDITKLLSCISLEE